MSAENQQIEKDVGPAPASNNAGEGAPAAPMMSAEEHEIARAAARFGYGPLAQVNTTEARLPPFGGEFQPGLYKSVEKRKFANPAPLGLSAFALTTFILSAINMGARDITEPNIVIGSAFGYGGLVQLLAGMWYVSLFLFLLPSGVGVSGIANGTREMAIGNTFGATALSSYGGFWLSFAIVLTPGGFEIQTTLAEKGGMTMFYNSMGLYLMAWFIFTTILLFCTLRSTVAFFLLFLFLDLTFLLLGVGYIQRDASGEPNKPVEMAGGFFGLMAAFAAWYNALAGIADNSNSFFIIPVAHFPWSPTGRSRRNKTDRETV